jgi:hypothetical protein
MFRGILQGFVQHPKETECDLLRQGLRDGFALKVNPYSSALRELPAEGAGRRVEAQIVELRRVQTMRQRPNVVPEIAYLVLDLTYGPAGFRRGRREVAIHHSQSYRQEREALIDVIVKFSRKPVTFLLVGYNPMAGDSVSPPESKPAAYPGSTRSRLATK